MKRRNIFFVIIIFLLLFSNIVSGCSTNQNNNIAGNYNCFEKVLFFSSENFPFLEGANYPLTEETDVQFIPLGGDEKNVYFKRSSTYGILEERKCINTFFFCDIESREYEIINNIPSELTNSFNNTCINSKGYLFAYIYGYEVDSYIISIDINSNIASPKKKEVGDVIDGGIDDIQCDNSYIYMNCGNNSLLVFDYDLNMVLEEKSNNGWIIIPNQNGVLLAQKDKKGIFRIQDNRLEKVKNNYIIPENDDFDDIVFFHGNDSYDFYFMVSDKKNGSIYDNEFFWGVNDKNIERVFSFNTMGLEIQSIHHLLVMNEYTILVDQFDIVSNIDEFYILKASDKQHDYSLNSKKEEIIIAGLYDSPTLEHLISSYNKKDKLHCLKYIRYNLEEEYVDNLNSLNIELTTSNKIDAIMLNGLDRDNLIEKGVLLDISNFLSMSNNVNEETIEKFIFEGMREEDGSIYSLFPEVSFKGMISNEQIDSKSIDNYIQMDSDKYYILSESPYNSEILLSDILRYSGNRFINQRSGELKIDDDFKRILRLLKKQQEISKKNGLESDSIEMLKEGNIDIKFGIYEMPYSYFFYKTLLGEDMKCTNISTEGPIIIPGDIEIGLVSTSKNIDVLYDFLDYIFDKDIYHVFFGNNHFPVLRESWDAWRERMTATQDYVDCYGDYIYRRDFFYSENNVKAYFGPIEYHEYEEMHGFFENSVLIQPLSDKYLAIIEEEVAYYFNGERTIDETCAIIEGRLKIAVNE